MSSYLYIPMSSQNRRGQLKTPNIDLCPPQRSEAISGASTFSMFEHCHCCIYEPPQTPPGSPPVAVYLVIQGCWDYRRVTALAFPWARQIWTEVLPLATQWTISPVYYHWATLPCPSWDSPMTRSRPRNPSTNLSEGSLSPELKAQKCRPSPWKYQRVDRRTPWVSLKPWTQTWSLMRVRSSDLYLSPTDPWVPFLYWHTPH